MKSLMKKVFAAAAAIATVFGLAATTVATANAADNATLTVSTTDTKFAGKTVNAYKMFSATVSSDGKAVSYTLTDEWKSFFKDSTASGLTGNGVTDANVSDKAYDYVSGLKNNTSALAAFATKASNWAQNKANNITAGATAKVSAAATDGKYFATFTGLGYGYYVVAVPGATVADTNSKYATLVSVNSTNVNATIKGALPTVVKKVNGKDDTDAKIGDTLTFTLTSTIPDMSAYSTYTFNFKDTLSKGLTFGQVNSVKVGDTTLTKDTDYTVSTSKDSQNNTLLTVAMKDFKTKQQANAGKKITVTYTATLNKDAVVGGHGNTNSATIQYSNNPSTGGTGESEPSKVRVFTYGFTVDKYTGDEYTDGAARLAGAKFTLAPKNGAPMSFVQVNAGSATANAVYRVAKADDTGATTIITTPQSGKVDFQGLKNGEYTLTETEAPAGYNKLASAIGVKVEGQNNGTDTTNATVTITYNNDNGSVYDQTASNGVIPVRNKSGVVLPGTGGMGTIAFTVIGVLVIALGVAWTLKRKNA